MTVRGGEKKRSRAFTVLLRFGGAFGAGIRRDYFRPNTSSAICTAFVAAPLRIWSAQQKSVSERLKDCLLYTSDAADEL